MHKYKFIVKKLFILSFIIVLSASQLVSQTNPGSDKTAWFRDARFGMFIHWGTYSLKGFEASWPLFGKQISLVEYEALAPKFNPVKFDADAIVKLAQSTGMKYLIFTSRHHDGFSMFNTAQNNYSIMHAPYGKDIVKQIVDACHNAGMRVGFYYSLCDWYNPDYRDKSKTFPAGCKPAEIPEATWPKFLTFLQGQLRELCSNYGKIDVIWFDGGWERTAEQWHSKELSDMIRSLQPGILINNRHLLEDDADFGTPEQYVPTGKQTKLWETCMTINNTWAYNPYDHVYKSTKELVQNLARTASGGGNYLLNIGPMPTGEVQPEFKERLKGMGEWMKVNGESIYGSQAGPSNLFPQGVATVKGSALYVHILEGPDGVVVLQGIKNTVSSARLLKNGELIPFKQNGSQIIMRIPYKILDPYDTVIKLELSGALDFDPAVYSNTGTSLALPASRAVIYGRDVKYALSEDALIDWKNKNDWIQWECEVPKDGYYEIVLNYFQNEEKNKTVFTLSIQNQNISLTPQKTDGVTVYKPVSIGKVNLKSGKTTAVLKPETLPEKSVFKLREMELRLVQ